MTKSLVTVLFIALSAACSLGVAPPTVAIPLRSTGFGGFELLVYDQSELVVAGGALEGSGGPFNDGVTARPEINELDVTWTGGACSHHPTLTITGSATDLHLRLVVSPAEWQLPFVSCPAVGILFGVTLTMDTPVTQEATTLEVVQ